MVWIKPRKDPRLAVSPLIERAHNKPSPGLAKYSLPLHVDGGDRKVGNDFAQQNLQEDRSVMKKVVLHMIYHPQEPL